jgi:hypothetical protein
VDEKIGSTSQPGSKRRIVQLDDGLGDLRAVGSSSISSAHERPVEVSAKKSVKRTFCPFLFLGAMIAD